jgi:hypothetical protein
MGLSATGQLAELLPWRLAPPVLTLKSVAKAGWATEKTRRSAVTPRSRYCNAVIKIWKLAISWAGGLTGSVRRRRAVKHPH